MPDQDVDDNPNAAAAQPSAPPLEKMDEVQGYHNIGFDGSMLPPPSYDEATREPPQRSEIAGYEITSLLRFAVYKEMQKIMCLLLNCLGC
jgi:hypothetical protein